MRAETSGSGLLVHLNLARGFRGGERQTELLVRELAGMGWRQRLVVRRGEALAKVFAGMPNVHLRMTGGSIPAAAAACRGASLVHVHEGRAVQAAWLAKLLFGIPYLVTRRVERGPRHDPFTRKMYRDAAAVVALSGAIYDALRTLDGRLRPRVIPSAHSRPAPDPAAVARIRERIGGSLVIGHVGALVDSHKGQRVLISAAREVIRQCPDTRIALVGSGRDERVLRELAADISEVSFIGQVDNVADWLGALDLFVYPSRHEGLGSVLLDAMACGVPVIASAVGGIPDIIRHEETGRLIPPGDASALVQEILLLALDAGLRDRTAAAGRRFADTYDPSRMAGSYAGLYRELADFSIRPQPRE